MPIKIIILAVVIIFTRPYETGKADLIREVEIKPPIKEITRIQSIKTFSYGGGEENFLKYSREEIELLARVVYAESRGEEYLGQIAVASVILNRLEDDRFPNNIYDIIYQPNQFDCVYDGQIHLEPDKQALSATIKAINGEDPTNGAIYFWNPKHAKLTSWHKTLNITTKIGNHVFAK